ncbi:F-box domain containing protein [Tanacetum coccineum]
MCWSLTSGVAIIPCGLPNSSYHCISITSLTIHRRCELPSSFLVDNVIKFKSLKRLKLKLVTNIDDNMIKHLTTSCPLLEELIVKYCHGLTRLCVYGLQNLQQVKFFFAGGRPPCLNVASCKKLTVCYYGNPPTCDSLKLSSHSLTTFVLHSDCDLEQLDIDTPNLLSFEWTFISDSPFAVKRPRSLTLESGFSSIHFEEWGYIVKFTYEKLLIQEDQGQTNIRIVTSSSSNAKKHFSDLTSLLTALLVDGPYQ